MIYLKYLRYVIRHKWFVFKAGLMLKVPIWQLIMHDMSKFRPDEFIPYARYFYGKKDPWSNIKYLGLSYYHSEEYIDSSFDEAWLMHQHRNKHHWQYWVLREDSGAVKPIWIPDEYRREMLADWIGAGLAINGKVDVWNWYKNNEDKIILNELTEVWLRAEIERLRVHYGGSYAEQAV